VAEKPRDAVVKFGTYRNVQRHHAVLPAIARHLDVSYTNFIMLRIYGEALGTLCSFEHVFCFIFMFNSHRDEMSVPKCIQLDVLQDLQ